MGVETSLEACDFSREFFTDAKYHNEFTPKYLLMFWNDSFGYWQEQIHVGSKKEALAYIRECEKSHCRMFA